MMRSSISGAARTVRWKKKGRSLSNPGRGITIRVTGKGGRSVAKRDEALAHQGRN